MTTTIRGTDNSAAAPALTGNDSDTGVYFPADNTLGLVTGGTERVSVTSTGNVAIVNGNLVFSTNGTGIDFSASAGGGATSSILDDYEEGTFTPKFADAASGGNESSSTMSGKYTKIGNVVYYVISVFNLSTAGLTSGNGAYVTGFPFFNASGFNTYFSPWTDTLNYDGYPMFGVANGSSYGFFSNCRDNTTDTSVLVSAFTSGVSDFYVSGFYYVS